MAESDSTETVGIPERHVDWKHAGLHVPRLIEECGRMLDYAVVEQRINVSVETTRAVVEAREAFVTGGWTTKLEVALYMAKAALSKAIQPVTVESLAPEVLEEAQRMVRHYFWLTLALAVFLIPASMLMFLSASLAEKSAQIIQTNDPIALALNAALDDYALTLMRAPKYVLAGNDGMFVVPPSISSPASGQRAASAAGAASAPLGASGSAATGPVQIPVDEVMAVTPEALDIKTRLQEFARNSRELYGTTQWLAGLNLEGYRNIYQSPWAETGEKLRKNLELTLPILQNPPPKDDDDPASEASPASAALAPQHAVDDARMKIAAYQDIRAASNAAQRTSTFFWGAVKTYLLPVMYALLGMMAFTLRDLCHRSVTKTYLPASARHINRAHFVVAMIVGTVIGLFSHLFTDAGISVSLLGIAFVVGYGSDKFFNQIDHLARTKPSHA